MLRGWSGDGAVEPQSARQRDVLSYFYQLSTGSTVGTCGARQIGVADHMTIWRHGVGWASALGPVYTCDAVARLVDEFTQGICLCEHAVAIVVPPAHDQAWGSVDKRETTRDPPRNSNCCTRGISRFHYETLLHNLLRPYPVGG